MKAQKNLEKLSLAYKNLFKTPDGKTVLADLEGKYFIHNTTITSLDMRDHELGYNEGQRSVVLEIKRQMTLDLDELKKRMESS